VAGRNRLQEVHETGVVAEQDCAAGFFFYVSMMPRAAALGWFFATASKPFDRFRAAGLVGHAYPCAGSVRAMLVGDSAGITDGQFTGFFRYRQLMPQAFLKAAHLRISRPRIGRLPGRAR